MKATNYFTILIFLVLIFNACSKKDNLTEKEPIKKKTADEITLADIKALESKMSTEKIIGSNSSGKWVMDDVILFKTKDNKFGKFRVLKIDENRSNRLSFVAAIFDANGEEIYRGRELELNVGTHCNLDIGQVVSATALKDFSWIQSATNVYELQPQSNAKFMFYK